ncbi:hypothetical protein GOP47_0010204 [Adiantum capillus-veneris]|uniref:Ubiquitin-like protease family profile domain-containing protein n=1 Tax=Adiantum capillus-veneris TaxID=13818 RepID=A0A9D4ZG40_ADICA|nr:hypothetical protein GOP47_0010204 [Adiantum capillus-veneris]
MRKLLPSSKRELSLKVRLHLGKSSPNIVRDSPLPISTLPLTIMIANRSIKKEFGSSSGGTKKLLKESLWFEFLDSSLHEDKTKALNYVGSIDAGTTSLMYFNSLKKACPNSYLPQVYRALRFMSINCSKESLKAFMESPRSSLNTIKHPQVSLQPNAIDCGFYVMLYMKKLIEGAYGKRSSSWITKSWFKHMKIEATKKSLASWAKEIIYGRSRSK